MDDDDKNDEKTDNYLWCLWLIQVTASAVAAQQHYLISSQKIYLSQSQVTLSLSLSLSITQKNIHPNIHTFSLSLSLFPFLTPSQSALRSFVFYHCLTSLTFTHTNTHTHTRTHTHTHTQIYLHDIMSNHKILCLSLRFSNFKLESRRAHFHFQDLIIGFEYWNEKSWWSF